MLKTRIITALLLAAGLLVVLFLLPSSLAAMVFALIVAAAAWEWVGLLRGQRYGRWIYAILTFAVCVFIYWTGMPAPLTQTLWLVALCFWLFVAPLWLRYKWPLAIDGLGLLVGWLLLIPSWAAMVVLAKESAWHLLAAMGLVWVADIAAYFCGRAWGSRRLAPSISPGKTWEGAMGAALFVVAYGIIIAIMMDRIKSLTAALAIVVALLAATAISIVGDLFESLAKRQAGVKDSSRILPGHGGILDRIDSLTSTLPLLAIVLQRSSP